MKCGKIHMIWIVSFYMYNHRYAKCPSVTIITTKFKNGRDYSLPFTCFIMDFSLYI